MIAEQVCMFFVVGVLVTTFPTVTAQGGNADFFLYNPCWLKPCHSYARCQIINGSQAVCVCPNQCPNLNRPVCGTDWKTYANMCELMTKTCKSNEWTQLRYYGACKSGDCSQTRWHRLRCPYYSVCRLNYGLPSCTCPENHCPSDYRPVCGTNGKTYPNACALKNASCKQKKWLLVRNLGHCRPDPCHKIDCCCGAQCRVNKTNHATCKCNFACPQHLDLVCGSDGKTYANGCKLRSAACAQQNPNLLQVSRGHCSNVKPTISPCATVKCGHYATCEVIGNQARCVCPSICHDVSEPVCGSDGKTYGNVCALKRTSCEEKREISVDKKGGCIVPTTPLPTINPCTIGKCAHYAKCEVVKKEPKCICPSLCLEVSKPVCGSDGKTYKNECHLKRTSCKDQRSISVDKIGVCINVPTTPTPTINPCTIEKCKHYAKCEVVNGEARCICPNFCLEVSKPVCGSDGKTYTNECHLKRRSCNDHRSISVVKQGVCVPTTPTPTINPCTIEKCKHYAKCEVVNGEARCICPNFCVEVSKPVCGSDGKTYTNECHLKRRSCNDNRSISVVKQGVCVPTTPTPTINPCTIEKCKHYAKCEVVNGEARCICPNLCLEVSKPVCGSDGKTYKNECHLKRRSCNDHRSISVVKQGVCESPCNLVDCCCGATCKVVNNHTKCECSFVCTEHHEPVCGSDGKTHSNNCKLRLHACRKGDPMLKEVNKGPCINSPTKTPTSDPCLMGKCGYHATCIVVESVPKCVCPSLCASVNDPVCGSDGHTYENECSLKRASCKDQIRVSVVNKGICERPTSCPKPRTCLNLCNKNECATRGQICCCKGCSFNCTTPMKRFGRNICPVDPLSCRSDRDCPNGESCCPDGCTSRCVAL